MRFSLIMSMTEDGSDSQITSFSVTSTCFHMPLQHYHRRQYIEVNDYFWHKADTQIFPKWTRWEVSTFNLIP